MGSDRWAKTITISIIFICICGTITFGIIYSEESPKSDYQYCIDKCPTGFAYKFKDLECPKMCEGLNEEVIYHTYVLNGTIHKTTYYPSNHSYTIDKPFTCDGKVFYTQFESYLEKCVNDLNDEEEGK